MTIEPRNRHLSLRPVVVEEEKEKVQFLLPEGYQDPNPSHHLYEILAVANDCEKVNAYDIGKMVLVNNSMVEELNIGEKVQYLMLENYVYGVCTDECAI